jgi:hypothetical protein
MLNSATKIEIAKSLEDLDAWNENAWQQSYDLVCPNENQDDLVKYALGVLVHYFALAGEAGNLQPDRQQLQALAAALRSGMSAADYRKKYE